MTEQLEAHYSASLVVWRPLMHEIELTNKLIDQVVYMHCNLNGCEVALVDGCQS